MKSKIKKSAAKMAVSLLLVTVIIFALAAPAFAVQQNSSRVGVLTTMSGILRKQRADDR